MLTFEEASAKIAALAKRLPAIDCQLSHANGLRLVDDLGALADSPRFDNSSVDGYAIHESDLDRKPELRLIGSIPAGIDSNSMTIGAGQTMSVFTGSPLPRGTAAVIMQEDVSPQSDVVTINEIVTKGENIRSQGREFRIGDVLIPAGSLLTGAHLALAASQGLETVRVYRRPMVGILTTGNEVIPPGDPLDSGQIYEASSYGLHAELLANGVHEVKILHSGDTVQECAEKLRILLDTCDIVISAGGVSVGQHDPVKAALKGLNVEEILWRVAMKPGKPFFAGKPSTGRAQAVFGLPGNPLSTMITFRVMVLPYLRSIMGGNFAEPIVQARLETQIEKEPNRLEFVPGKIATSGPALTITATDFRISSMLRGLADSNGLIVFPLGQTELAADTVVDVIPWTSRGLFAN